MAKHTHTILSMMKNEGHCLLEWLAYHRLLGFDNICVYTNNCTDATDRMLMRLEEMGECQHFRNDVPEGKKPQPNALNLAQNNPEVCDTDWLLVMDADEFLNIKAPGGTVQDLRAALPDNADGINITWRFFGSNDVTDWNPGLVTECLTRAAPDDFKKGWGVKTMFRPYEHMKLGIHRPHIKKARQFPERTRALIGQTWFNGSGKEMATDFKLSGWRSTKPTLGYDLVEMNHYAVKSYEAYLLRRMRGNVNNKEDKYSANYFSIFDRNETEVRGAADRAPLVRAKMDEWLKDDTLRALQDEALAFHTAQVARLRETGEYEEWITSLKEAGKISIDQLDEVLFTLHLPAKYQEVVRQLRAKGVPDKVIAKMVNAEQTGRKAATRRDLQSAAEGEDAEEDDSDPSEETDVVTPADNGTTPEEIANAIVARLNQAARRARDGGGTDRKAERAANKMREAAAPAAPEPAPAAKPRFRVVLKRPGGQFGLRTAKPGTTTGRKIVLATMKNEGPYLLEWIAHYQNLGFEEFVLFSNDCSDGTNLMLNRLDALGIVRHFDNPLGPRMDPQRRAYSRANKMGFVRDADWVLIADADEFLNVHVGDGSVDALIEACPPNADAISVNWRIFGSGGARHMDPAPVTQRFTRACNVVKPENGLVWGFKTLFRPSSFDYFGVHRPRFRKEREVSPDQVKWVGASGKDMGEQYLRSGWRSNKNIITYEFAQMNHYAIKSREEFLLKKLRGTANSKDKNRIDMGYWEKFDLNAFEDTSIRSGDLQGRIDTLLQDPDLAALHRAALDTALRTIEQQLEEKELRAFVEGDLEDDDADRAAS